MRIRLRPTLAMTLLTACSAALVACGDEEVTQPQPPNPFIASVSPEGKFQGEGAFALAVSGRDLVATAADPVALWNGEPRPTRPIDETGLWVDIGADDLSTPGEAEIRVIVFDDGGESFPSNTVTFRIVAAPVSLTVTPPDSDLDVGASIPLNATALLSDGTTAAVHDRAAWAVDELRIARVSNQSGSKGRLTGVASGGTRIHARFFNLTADARVIVGRLSDIDVSPTSATLTVGESLQLFATGQFADGDANDLTALVDWTSSQPGVADFGEAAGLSGTLTALASGSTTITATLREVTTSLVVTVTP